MIYISTIMISFLIINPFVAAITLKTYAMMCSIKSEKWWIMIDLLITWIDRYILWSCDREKTQFEINNQSER